MLGPVLWVAWASAAPAAPDLGERALGVATRFVDEIGPRPAGSEAAERAQVWVARELLARGWRSSRIAGGVAEGTVLACRRGADERTLLLLAHTDSVHALGPGANDNAAAVGVLLTVAEALPARSPRGICLGFPGGEEIGLRGSAALAESFAQPLDLVVSLDVVGRGRLSWNGLGPVWGTRRLGALLTAAPADVPWVYRAVSHALPGMERSDHRSFAASAPSAHLMARAESGFDPAYHTADDTPDRLEPATLDAAVGAVLGLAAAGPLPVESGDAAMVVPGTVVVVPGAGVLAMVGLAGGLGVFGLLGRVPWRAEIAGWLVLASGSSIAALAATSAACLAAAGRFPGASLAEASVLAAWAAWAAVVALWPRPAPASTGRRFAIVVGAALAGALTWGGALLLAVPLWIGVGVAGASRWLPSRPSVAWGPVLAVALVFPGYFLRPDAVRELAFHGLVPASPVVWGVGWLLLAAPAWGLFQGRVLPRWRGYAGLALLGFALAACAAGWLTDARAPPYEARTVLRAGR